MFLCAYTHQEDQAQTKIAVRQWVELVFCAVSWNLFSRGWWIKNATFSDQVSPGMQWKVHQSEDCRKVGSFSVKFRGFGCGRGGIFVNLVALAIVKSEACSLARLQQWSFTTTRSDVGGRSCASVSAIECQFSRGLGWECVCVRPLGRTRASNVWHWVSVVRSTRIIRKGRDFCDVLENMEMLISISWKWSDLWHW